MTMWSIWKLLTVIKGEVPMVMWASASCQLLR